MKITTTVQIDADLKAAAKAKKIRLGNATEAGIKAALKEIEEKERDAANKAIMAAAEKEGAEPAESKIINSPVAII